MFFNSILFGVNLALFYIKFFIVLYSFPSYIMGIYS
jgi:hypothetical protein